MYISAVTLTKGIYFGQQTHLTPVQFIAVATVFNFFGDYEIPYNDGIIEKNDFVRAAQDGNLPFVYTPIVVE